MKNLWNETEAQKFKGDLLKLRVYTSQLLGAEEDLVLHGGGNTSVKIIEENIFSEKEEILYVKGSGWDLATIKEEGFAPVKRNVLLQLAELNELSDTEMVKQQRMGMIDPSAPNPSVEAILHAIIPKTFVDHTHADAVVTISNTLDGKKRLEEIYGNKMLILPYVMPGFILAKQIYELAKGIEWDKTEGIILLNHGVFTFNDDPRLCYEKMIEIVTKAENYLREQGCVDLSGSKKESVDIISIARLRKQISDLRKQPVIAHLDDSSASIAFSNLIKVDSISQKGPLTPDHIIRTKRMPMILNGDTGKNLKNYSDEYKNYFNEFNTGKLISLDTAPRWAIWPKKGTLVFDVSMKDINILKDITGHTMKAIYKAEKLGGWNTLCKKDLFEMEYWSLEQEKIKKGTKSKPMQGKIALVTGAYSGIGKACAQRLVTEGAVVAALDINPSIINCFDQNEILGIQCDVTDTEQLNDAVKKVVTHFGGIDLLVSNAGLFPVSLSISQMDQNTWSESLSLNLTSHQKLLTLCLPYLEIGIDPAVIIVGSKNVQAPGPGASAYSVAKAGLTQLGRIAAMELGTKGIRVNIIHPNSVFDTAIWTDSVLETRAKHYSLSVEEYKTNNIMKVEVTSKDVAEMIVIMLGPGFSKTTGAQIPIDGGNDRVI